MEPARNLSGGEGRAEGGTGPAGGEDGCRRREEGSTLSPELPAQAGGGVGSQISISRGISHLILLQKVRR